MTPLFNSQIYIYIYSGEQKTCIHRNLYMNVYNIITHNSQKRNKVPSTTWMYLENIMLRKRKPDTKVTYGLIPLI